MIILLIVFISSSIIQILNNKNGNTCYSDTDYTSTKNYIGNNFTFLSLAETLHHPSQYCNLTTATQFSIINRQESIFSIILGQTFWLEEVL